MILRNSSVFLLVVFIVSLVLPAWALAEEEVQNSDHGAEYDSNSGPLIQHTVVEAESPTMIDSENAKVDFNKLNPKQKLQVLEWIQGSVKDSLDKTAKLQDPKLKKISEITLEINQQNRKLSEVEEVRKKGGMLDDGGVNYQHNAWIAGMPMAIVGGLATVFGMGTHKDHRLQKRGLLVGGLALTAGGALLMKFDKEITVFEAQHKLKKLNTELENLKAEIRAVQNSKGSTKGL